MSTSTTGKIRIGLGTALAALAFTGGCAAPAAGADEPTVVGEAASAVEETTGIIAAGSGHVRVAPDSARIRVGVEAQAKLLDEVETQANEKMQKTLARLRALRIPELQMQTSVISVDPVHATTPEGVRLAAIVGYSASNQVSVAVRKAPPDKIAEHVSAILNAALQSGANVTGGLELFLDDPSSAEAQALEDAVKDARRNADIMAKASGVTITGIASVSQAGASSPWMAQSSQFFGGIGAISAAPAAPVETGDIVVSSDVTVRFTFR